MSGNYVISWFWFIFVCFSLIISTQFLIILFPPSPACMSACMPLFLPSCLPACSFVCQSLFYPCDWLLVNQNLNQYIFEDTYLPARLLPWIHVCLSYFMSSCLSFLFACRLCVCLSSHLFFCLPACLPARSPACYAACLASSRLLILLPTCLTTSLPIYCWHACLAVLSLSACLSAWLSTCLSSWLPVQNFCT